jgi:hypothetical protein
MYLGSEDVVVDLVHDWFDVVLSYQRCLMDDSWTYQDISAELVGLILDRGVFLRDDSPDISSSFSNTLHISFHHYHIRYELTSTRAAGRSLPCSASCFNCSRRACEISEEDCTTAEALAPSAELISAVLLMTS